MIILAIIMIIVAIALCKSNDEKVMNHTSSFEVEFMNRMGQDPVSYIIAKLDGGSDRDAVRYLFGIIETEIEKRSKSKSLGFDFYFAKAMSKMERNQPEAPIPRIVSTPVATQVSQRTRTVNAAPANQSQRHRWTFEEDCLCCRRFFEQYVLQYSSMEVQFFAQQLQRELPDVSVGSLRMKAQNIQQLCLEYGIKSSFTAKPLTQYSQQNRRAFMQVKKEFDL